MTESGKVVKLKSDRAVIRIDRKSACDSCRMCAIRPSSAHVDIILKNTVNAKIDDIVTVEMSDHVVINSSLLVYIIPLVTAFIGLLIGIAAFDKMAYQLLSFTGFLVLGFIAVAVVDKIIRKNKKYTQKITGIVTEDKDNDKDAKFD